MRLSEQDLSDIRGLIQSRPGASLSRLKIHSRHAQRRVREAVERLECAGDVVVVEYGNDIYVWPAEEADAAASMLERDGAERLEFDGA